MTTPRNPEMAAPAYDDAEKGLHETPQHQMAVVQYDYPKDKKDPNLITPTVIPAPSPPKPSAPKPVSKRRKVSNWIVFQLWFNTYRYVVQIVQFAFQLSDLMLMILYRKLFTFVFTLNMIGIGLAASGHWPYAIQFNGAMALGNLNFAVLMRNEVFGRCLYLFVNTFFAKVCRLFYPLRPSYTNCYFYLVDPFKIPSGLHVRPSGTIALILPYTLSVLMNLSASRRYSQRVRCLWNFLAVVEGCSKLDKSRHPTQPYTRNGHGHQPLPDHRGNQCVPLGTQHSS